MREYIKTSGKRVVINVLLEGLGYDIRYDDIYVTVDYYLKENGVFEYRGKYYHGYICYRIGECGRENVIYYDYWRDTDTFYYEYNAVIVSNSGDCVAKVG